jgi:hypothetical protein
MSDNDFFATIERELSAAATRGAHIPWHRRLALKALGRKPGRGVARPLIVALAVLLSFAGVALATRVLIGAPVPREYPHMGGAVLRKGTRLLSLRVPDPSGGPPWGMRVIFTTAHPPKKGEEGVLQPSGLPHWGCVQIGRVVDGRLGALGRDGAFHNDGLFHELPIEPGGCGSLDRKGMAGLGVGSVEPASAYQGLEGCVSEEEKRGQLLVLPTIERELAVARMEGDGQGVRGALDGLAQSRRMVPRIEAEMTCPAADLRVISFGIAGAGVRGVDVRGQWKKIHVSPRDGGAYLVVRRVRPGERVPPVVGFPQAARKAQQPAPPTALSRAAERDPATPNPVTVTPERGGRNTTFKLTFHALLNGGGYSYAIETDGSRRCEREAERATGGDGVAIGRIPIVRGQLVSKTITSRLQGLCPGSYRVYVAYSNLRADTLPNYPFATARFTVRPR